MAVPDWPSTYGYNLFLYPWQTWLAGPWDIVRRARPPAARRHRRHDHDRAVARRFGERRSRVGCAGSASRRLLLVIFQGVLGGMRVLLDERTLAMLHGCTGPLFFASHGRDGRVHLAAVAVTRAGSTQRDRRVGQIRCLGDCHVHPGVSSNRARRRAAPRAGRHRADDLRTGRAISPVPGRHSLAAYRRAGVDSCCRAHDVVKPLGGLACDAGRLCLSLQLALGGGTWIVKFAVPAWAPGWISTRPRRGPRRRLAADARHHRARRRRLAAVGHVAGACALCSARLLLARAARERHLAQRLEAAV